MSFDIEKTHLVPASEDEIKEIERVIGFDNLKKFRLKPSLMKTVVNEDLESKFKMSKAKLQEENCFSSVKEKLLIHATGADNVPDIIYNNFNIRVVRRHKFGMGTSFTPDACYANQYANTSIGDDRVFIICNVLISKYINVEANYNKRPPAGYDTTTGYGGTVVVKYNIDEVLPKYVAYYKKYKLFDPEMGPAIVLGPNDQWDVQSQWYPIALPVSNVYNQDVEDETSDEDNNVQYAEHQMGPAISLGPKSNWVFQSTQYPLVLSNKYNQDVEDETCDEDNNGRGWKQSWESASDITNQSSISKIENKTYNSTCSFI